MAQGRRMRAVVLSLAAAALVFFVAAYFFSLGLPGGRKKPRKVARIDISGPILTAGDTIDEIKKFRQDDSVAVILVRVDSPGGAVSPSQDIYAELMKVREQTRKKVVASIGNLGASGGYYIASAANKIYASPGSLVGSIGVLLELTRFEDLLKKIGVESDVVKSGTYKDIGSPLRKMTADERALLQGVIDDTLRQFVAAVAKGRRLPEDQVTPLADGRIFTGSQAKELGLVDELGGIEDAVDAAARLGAIEGKPEVIKTPKRWTWRSFFEDASSFLGGRLPLAQSPGLLYLWHP